MSNRRGGGRWMLADSDDCVLCGGQGLIQGRPCGTVGQDDVETFILFFG